MDYDNPTKEILTELFNIKLKIHKSDHQRVDGWEDYELSHEEIVNSLIHFGLEEPMSYHDPAFCESHWTRIFGHDQTEQEVDEIMNNDPRYKVVSKHYKEVYNMIIKATKEEGAYYMWEEGHHQEFLNSLRGIL